MHKTNFINNCRFCLAPECQKKVDLNQPQIKDNYREITNIELEISEKYSNFSCQKCIENLETCATTKKLLIENHNFLSNQWDSDIKIEEIEAEFPQEATNNSQRNSYNLFGVELDLKEETLDIPSKPKKRAKKRTKIRKGKKEVLQETVTPDRVNCPDCGKIIHPRNLLKHQKNVHLKQKDYTCDVCGRQFFKKYAVLCHLRVSFCSSKLY